MKRGYPDLTCRRLCLSLPAVFVFTLSLLLASCSSGKKTGVNSTLKIGIAEVNYAPEVGLDLVGNYRGDDYASRGVHDSLYAKALVAADKDGQKVATLLLISAPLPGNRWNSCGAILLLNPTLRQRIL